MKEEIVMMLMKKEMMIISCEEKDSDNVRERSGDDYSFDDDIDSNNKYNDQDILQYNISDISRKYKQKNIVNIEPIKIPEKYVTSIV